MGSAVHRAVPSWLLADPHAVLHLGLHVATDLAVRADVLAVFDGNTRLGRRAGVGLAHGVEREATERGKAARRQPRAAQERAAIETAACLRRKRVGERAATALAMRPLDQHGRPSLRGIAVDAVKVL